VQERWQKAVFMVLKISLVKNQKIHAKPLVRMHRKPQNPGFSVQEAGRRTI